MRHAAADRDGRCSLHGHARRRGEELRGEDQLVHAHLPQAKRLQHAQPRVPLQQLARRPELLLDARLDVVAVRCTWGWGGGWGLA